MNKSFNDSAFIECEKGREILYKTQIDLKKQITKLTAILDSNINKRKFPILRTGVQK